MTITLAWWAMAVVGLLFIALFRSPLRTQITVQGVLHRVIFAIEVGELWGVRDGAPCTPWHTPLVERGICTGVQEHYYCPPPRNHC